MTAACAHTASVELAVDLDRLIDPRRHDVEAARPSVVHGRRTRGADWRRGLGPPGNGHGYRRDDDEQRLACWTYDDSMRFSPGTNGVAAAAYVQARNEPLRASRISPIVIAAWIKPTWV